MRRTDRLFELIQIFRDGRLHTGRDLAERMEVSLRTIYRDIDTLVGSGVPITGERGVGYMLTEPLFLPPLTLTATELEALELGLALVQSSFGAALGEDAATLGDKVRSVLPSEALLARRAPAIALHEPLVPAQMQERVALLRRAILSRSVQEITYRTGEGAPTRRAIRPLEIEPWSRSLTVTAWCELREDFRVFRLDRIVDLQDAGRGFRNEPGKRLADYFARTA